MLRAILFLEFDVVTGVTVRAQFPPNAFGSERLFFLGDELIYSSLCHSDFREHSVLPLESSILFWDSLAYLFVPVMMRNDMRYPRGVYRWSLIMVLDSLKPDHFTEPTGPSSHFVLPSPKLVRRHIKTVNRSAERLILRLASRLLRLELHRYALSATSPNVVAIPLEGVMPSHVAGTPPAEDPVCAFLADVFSQLSTPRFLPGRPLPLATGLTVLPPPWPPRSFAFRLWQPPAACRSFRGPAPSSPLSLSLPPLDAIPYVLDGAPVAALSVPSCHEAPPPPSRNAPCGAANGWGNLCPGDPLRLRAEALDASASSSGGGVDLITELIWPWLDGQTSIALLYIMLRRLRMMAFAKLRAPWDRFCGQPPAYAPPLVDLVSPVQLQRRIAELAAAGLVGLRQLQPCVAQPAPTKERRVALSPSPA